MSQSYFMRKLNVLEKRMKHEEIPASSFRCPECGGTKTPYSKICQPCYKKMKRSWGK